MKKNLILLEFKNVSSAFFILDYITKNFNVGIEESKLICPGRYLLVFSGNQGEIDNIRKEVEKIKLEDDKYKYILIKIVSGASKTLLEKLNKKIQYPEYIKSLGILEFSTTAKVIEASDFIEDQSPITIITIKIGIGMCAKGIVIFEGDTSAINNVISRVKGKIRSFMDWSHLR